ncbi:MAG: hypothetical protein HZC51_06585, partial [Nitrospirae bacterium]|nr:hypothetical protein [Nitrospirota bacterium]
MSKTPVIGLIYDKLGNLTYMGHGVNCYMMADEADKKRYNEYRTHVSGRGRDKGVVYCPVMFYTFSRRKRPDAVLSAKFNGKRLSKVTGKAKTEAKEKAAKAPARAKKTPPVTKDTAKKSPAQCVFDLYNLKFGMTRKEA